MAVVKLVSANNPSKILIAAVNLVMLLLGYNVSRNYFLF